MGISNEAVEAAMEAYYANGEEPFEGAMRAALEAAAPHLYRDWLNTKQGEK